jgi:hypothetical protein
MARYDAFILRIWRSGTGDERQWAGRVEHLPAGATLRFDNPAALLAYLGAELAGESDARPTTPSDDGASDTAKGVAREQTRPHASQSIASKAGKDTRS